MILKASLNEATAMLSAVLAVLQQTPQSLSSLPAADLTYATSLLKTNAPARIIGGALSGDLRTCFTLALEAGAPLPAMTAVYTAATALAPVGKPAAAVVAACRSYAVIAMGRILNATTFTSRDDVDAALKQIGACFDVVEAAAGNSLQTDLYRALIQYQAATTANLNAQSYPLPRLVAYQFGATMTALTLANRLYGDASRAQELAAENGAFNPAFMPVAGRALSG